MTRLSGNLERLLSASSPGIADGDIDESVLPEGSVAEDLKALLWSRNGFFAFESALLVRPLSLVPGQVLGVRAWNSSDLWKRTFPSPSIEEVTFFAEDVFGGQFGVTSDFVVSLSPEDGEIKEFAGSMDDWAKKILADYNVLTGYPLARDWQRAYGPLAPGRRLVPKTPFILGGEFNVENLIAVPDLNAMRFYGGLAASVSSVPDGADIVLKVQNLSTVLDSGAEG